MIAVGGRCGTSDLWLAAVLDCETNCKLIDVQYSKKGRKTIFFTFEGEDLTQMAEAYCQDEAIANVTALRASMNKLRDLIFTRKKY